MSATQIAEYAAQAGPNAADRPPYDSSPNGMAFRVGLWARERGITVQEVKAGRGYTYTLNRSYRLDFKGEEPTIQRIA